MWQATRVALTMQHDVRVLHTQRDFAERAVMSMGLPSRPSAALFPLLAASVASDMCLIVVTHPPGAGVWLLLVCAGCWVAVGGSGEGASCRGEALVLLVVEAVREPGHGGGAGSFSMAFSRMAFSRKGL